MGGGKKYVFPPHVNRDSEFLRAFFRGFVRPICYECPFKSCRSGSDVTVGDYWGIDRLHPEMDDDKGTSMVYLNTEKGISFFSLDEVRYMETCYEEALPFNSVVTSIGKPKNRDAFYRDLDKYDSVLALLRRYTHSTRERVIQALLGDKGLDSVRNFRRSVRAFRAKCPDVLGKVFGRGAQKLFHQARRR